MHPKNNATVIGNSFYEAAGASHQKKIEAVYNKIYGVLPTMATFTEEFMPSVLPAIAEHFDVFCQDINSVNGHQLKSGIWLGKTGTIYSSIMLGVNFKSKLGDDLFYDGAIQLHTLHADKTDKFFDETYVSVKIACMTDDSVPLVVAILKGHEIEKKHNIFMLTNSYGELTLTPMPVEPKLTDLALNYGPDFVKYDEQLIDSLHNKKSGLYLFYGPPGTGKSSYIKHLLSCGITRKMAYIPVGLIDQLVSPDMLPLLMDNKGLILVLEDAEKALLSREISDHAALVSSILNLTDGFIGESLNITVIATFNTAREKIDEALLRKGRLKMSYEFKRLGVQESKNLAVSIGVDPARITTEMSIADIYYLNDDTGYTPKEERKVGFNS